MIFGRGVAEFSVQVVPLLVSGGKGSFYVYFTKFLTAPKVVKGRDA